MKQFLALIAFAASLFSVAHATPLNRNLVPIQGPPITEVESPYQPALMCMRDAVRVAYAEEHQRNPNFVEPQWAVGSFPDQTGRFDNGTSTGGGAYMSQGLATMLMTSLGQIFDHPVNFSPEYLRQVQTARAIAGNRPMTMSIPTFIINGGMNSLDFSGGGGVSIRSPITLGHREHRVIMGFDASVTTMPYDQYAAGMMLTSFRYTKQVVGYENEAGLTRFFGAPLVDFNLGQENRGFVQAMSRNMMDVVAFRAVRDVMRITSCDEMFLSAETNANISSAGVSLPPPPPALAPIVRATPPAPQAPVVTPAPQQGGPETIETPKTQAAAPTPQASQSPAPTKTAANAPRAIRPPATGAHAPVAVERQAPVATPSNSPRTTTTAATTRSPVVTRHTTSQSARRAPARGRHISHRTRSPRPDVTRTPSPTAEQLGLRRLPVSASRTCHFRRCVLESSSSQPVHPRRLLRRISWTGNENPFLYAPRGWRSPVSRRRSPEIRGHPLATAQRSHITRWAMVARRNKKVFRR